jgi:cellobiose-specific phosphotransferase system component IIC
MEARNVIFSVVMVFFAFVLAYRWVNRFGNDPVVIASVVILVGMIALLFLSVDERLKRIEMDLSEKERSLRVSMQSVEDEVREKVNAATRKLEDIRESMVKRGYR